MRRIVLMIVAAIALISCGTSGKVAQKSVKTYVQPGSELLGAPNVLRAWAMGISDSEMTAKKKAMASASAELARMLNSVVTTTIEDYCVSLSEGEVAASKEFLSQKTNIVSNQLLKGVRPIFDQWEPADSEGMYRNYVVLELTGEEFIKKLVESLGNTPGQNQVKIDEKLLNDLFIKTINSTK